MMRRYCSTCYCERSANTKAALIRHRAPIALAALHAYYAARGYVSIGSSNHPGYPQPTFIEMEKRLA